MMTVDVPQTPPLATVPNVELMHTGTWPISTGIATFTTEDLTNAVAALDCPAVRRPVLKLGHDEPDPQNGLRWDGEPAIGSVTNMAVAENGRTLVGDYTGMPGWLGDILASAYPDRSIEGQYDFRCQLGHTHPFVLTAVALLGVTPPGIGTLQSLQDVAALYGVAAAADEPGEHATAFTLTVKAAAQEDSVPNPSPPQVAASVTTEDVRRAFYSSDLGKSWDIWIEELQLDPLQLITVDDASGARSRVPVTVGDGDGEAAVSFGEPVKVVIRYEDAPAVAASAGERRVIRFASRAESRPAPTVEVNLTQQGVKDKDVAAAMRRVAAASGLEPVPQTPPAEPEDNPTPPNEGAHMALDEGLRQRLGLAEDADEATILEALDTALNPKQENDGTEQDKAENEPAPVAAGARLPEGVVTIDEAKLAELQAQAAEGVAARAQQRAEARDRDLNDAIKAGKIPPARREHWQRLYDTDPEGTKQTLASLSAGVVPLEDKGTPGGENDLTDPFDAELRSLYPPHMLQEG
jgi:Mu-like prophage I protein